MLLTLQQIKERIFASGISEPELQDKIKKKMDELSGLITEEGAAHIIANELGMNLAQVQALVKIGSLTPGLRQVEAVGKVIQKYDVREFQTVRGPGKVGSFLYGDETGVIRVVLWNDQATKLSDINVGDVIKLSSGYVRDNNGRKELHLNERSAMIVNPPGETVTVVEKPASSKKHIKELTAEDEQVELLVTLVDIYDPHFFTICPTCNRRANESNGVFNCLNHGAVTPIISYVVNALGDDGSDTIRIAFWRQQAEHLLKQESSAVLHYKDYPEQFQEVKHKLLGEVVKVVGKVRKNEMFDRLEFNAQLVFFPEAQELQRLEKAV